MLSHTYDWKPFVLGFCQNFHELNFLKSEMKYCSDVTDETVLPSALFSYMEVEYVLLNVSY